MFGYIYLPQHQTRRDANHWVQRMQSTGKDNNKKELKSEY